MTIQQRLDEIASLALRQFPTHFEYAKRIAFRLEKVEQLCREYDAREKLLVPLQVKDWPSANQLKEQA